VKCLTGEAEEVLRKKGIAECAFVSLGLWHGRMGLGLFSELPRFSLSNLESLASLKNPADLRIGPLLGVGISPNYRTLPEQRWTEGHTDLLALELPQALTSLA